MYRLALVALLAGVLSGQTKPSAEEILKEAVTLHQQGKLDQAIRGYELFLTMYPDAPAVRSNLGAALVATGHYSLAIDQYKRALMSQAEPDVRLNLALAYYKSSQYQDAIRELQTVLEHSPDNTKATLLLADCELRGGNNKKVIALLRPLSQASPSDMGTAYLLGTALVRDGQIEEGQRVINPILSGADSAEARLLMGTTKFVAREFAASLVDFAKALELNPKLPDVYSYYGLALFATGDVEGSRKAYLAAIEQDPNNFDANLHLGTIFRQDQNFEVALQYLRRASNVRPEDLATKYQIALVDLAMGKTVQAREELEALVKSVPTFTEAHVSLATVYYREKRKEDGDRERAIVQKLNAEKQAKQPGAKLSAGEASAP